MRERFRRFMMGRYGMDQLGQFLNGVSILFLILSLFPKLNLFYLPGLILLIYSYFRIFSRNYGARSMENQRFLQVTGRIRSFFWSLKQDKNSPYRIYPCPGCGQKIRVPKGKGKIEITCPKCQRKFRKRT